MEKKVYGVYGSNTELTQAIQSLQANGLKADDVTVVVYKKEDLQLSANHQNVNVIYDEENEGFIDKIMHFFVEEGSGGIRAYLGQMGFSDAETSVIFSDAQEGKFIILLDKEADVTGKASQDTAPIPTKEAAAMSNQNQEPVINMAAKKKIVKQEPEPENRHGLEIEVVKKSGDDSLQTGMTRNPDPNIFPDATAGLEADQGAGGQGQLLVGEGITTHTSEGHVGQEAPSQSGDLNEDNIQLDEDGNPIMEGEYVKNRVNTDHL
ncbi:general stress protein [Bacillus massiliglaciei]|uniref:general stress protein n=1 Tax=Bacillus massiliglaciei TaxID=1816693 RepID=UPI000DA627CD|nr:general stress protein [Bacillus massiliglaciei]